MSSHFGQGETLLELSFNWWSWKWLWIWSWWLRFLVVKDRIKAPETASFHHHSVEEPTHESREGSLITCEAQYNNCNHIVMNVHIVGLSRLYIKPNADGHRHHAVICHATDFQVVVKESGQNRSDENKDHHKDGPLLDGPVNHVFEIDDPILEPRNVGHVAEL